MKTKTYNNFELRFGNTYMIDSDYDYEYDCSLYGCDSICRCGKITNLKIKKVNKSLNYLVIEQLYKDKSNKIRKKSYNLTKIEKYCADRLMRIYKAYDKNLYSLEVSNGYYGEEISGFEFENYDEMLDSINTMLEKETDIQKIKFALSEEYSYLLDNLIQTNTITIEQIPLDKIGLNGEYVSRLKKDSSYASYDFELNLPVGVVKRINNQYFLIDGYHRFLDLKDNEKEAPYIIMRQCDDNVDGETPVEYPDPCPSCGTQLEAETIVNGGGVYCPNNSCSYRFCY
jgi:hypothetical protein